MCPSSDPECIEPFQCTWAVKYVLLTPPQFLFTAFFWTLNTCKGYFMGEPRQLCDVPTIVRLGTKCNKCQLRPGAVLYMYTYVCIEDTSVHILYLPCSIHRNLLHFNPYAFLWKYPLLKCYLHVFGETCGKCLQLQVPIPSLSIKHFRILIYIPPWH